MREQETYDPWHTCPDCGQQAASPNAHHCLRAFKMRGSISSMVGAAAIRDIVMGGPWECPKCEQTHRTSSIHCREIDLSAVDMASIFQSENNTEKTIIVGKTE